jgi:CheY-like chemotaxis protein
MTKEEFIDQLRNDLSHLYNPERLRQSPLSLLFGVAKRFDTGPALQRILIEAVNSLEPSPDEPQYSPAWQIYEPLYYRYVEQLSPEEVADQMAISVRHLRRKQQTAVEALADTLWGQYDLKGIISEGQDIRTFDERENPANSTVNEDLAWVKETASNSSANLNQTFLSLANLAQKLADSHDVHLDTVLDDSLPQLAVDPVVLRQMILNLLQVAIPRASGESIRISARPLDWGVELRIWCPERTSGHKPVLDDESANLNMAQRLADMSGCKLDLSVNARSFDVTLVVPVLEQLPILVIDDNLDALQMLSRYAYGSRYHVITSHEPEQAITLAELHLPKAIVLDVMMPHVDGWELFQRLRQHPPTADIPIIICTILAQKKLALLLGARDFLRKPISRQTFLSALDQCIG